MLNPEEGFGRTTKRPGHQSAWTNDALDYLKRIKGPHEAQIAIVADIYDKCILGLNLMRKYGLIMDLKNGLIRASTGDIPLQAWKQLQSSIPKGPSIEMLMDCHKDLVVWSISSVNVRKRMKYLSRS